MKILLTGATGQVGRSLSTLASQRDFELAAFTRETLDITDAESVAAAVKNTSPDIVINAAAYTAVDKAETEPEKALAINRDGVMHIAQACAETDIPLIHYSTDYVFDGNKPSPYTEDDAVNPLGIYGISKLAGEEMVRRYCPRHIILRVSWVFSEYGNNFVKTMLRLGRERDELRIVNDQRGCPTSAWDIAQASLTIAESIVTDGRVSDTCHFASAQPTSWFGFAQSIFAGVARQNAYPAPRLVPIYTSEYPTPARRPLNSVLDCGKLRERFGITPPSWTASLERVLSKLNETAIA